MNKHLSTLAADIKVSIAKHAPEILIGIGITGMITATALAVSATPKALSLIEKKKAEKIEQFVDTSVPEEKDITLTMTETIKSVWICYIPAAVTSVFSIGCLIGANSVHKRRNAAFAAAYTLSESALRKYCQKVTETIGEKKEKEIRDAIAKDTIEAHPVKNAEVIFTEKGHTLCYDTISGRYFRSDRDSLIKAANKLNSQMRDEMYIALNEFYYEIGLPPLRLGEDLGWNMSSGYIDLRFSAQLAEDETPCLVLDYSVAPQYEFRSF